MKLAQQDSNAIASIFVPNVFVDALFAKILPLAKLLQLDSSLMTMIFKLNNAIVWSQEELLASDVEILLLLLATKLWTDFTSTDGIIKNSVCLHVNLALMVLAAKSQQMATF